MGAETKPRRTGRVGGKGPTAKGSGRPPTDDEKGPVDEPATITAVTTTNGHPQPIDPNAGTYALAMLSDEEFSERLEIMKRGRDRIAQIQRDIMEQDVDFGLIPGTPKPTLFKSGAEKLALVYRLAARMESTFTPGDGQMQPPLRYEVACYLHHLSFDGPIVAMGHGTANSWEKRYRRESDKACPDCGKTAIIRSKFEPGWFCFPKKGGCGHKFAPDDERLAQQSSDPRGNPVEANDLQNTLLKMAEKRAFVDAVLRATASSSLFTQDVVEEPADERIVSEGGAVVNADGEVVERAEDTQPEAEIQTTTEEGVGRGGHREQATQIQVDQVKKYSKELKLGPHGLADQIADVFGGGIDSTMLPEEPKEAAAEVMEFLTNMLSTDIGKLLVHLRKLQESKG